MAKIRYEIKVDTSLIDDLFDVALKSSSKITKFQARVYKSLYKKRITSLYYILKKKLRRFLIADFGDSFVAEQEGEEQFIKDRENEWNKFINADESTLNKDPEYLKFQSDKGMRKMRFLFKKYRHKLKSKTCKIALGNGTVGDFYNGLGIIMKQQVIY